MMSSHIVSPWKGHMEQLYYMFVYLNKYHKSDLVHNQSDQVIDKSELLYQYWTSGKFVHIYSKEDLPPNMSAPRDLCFVVMPRVDGDHDGDTFTQRYRTGIQYM